MKFIIISILFFIIFLIHSFLMLKGKWYSLDNKFYNNLKFSNLKTLFLKIITNLSSTFYFLILSIFMLLLLPFKRQVVIIIIGLIIDSLVIYLIKHLVRRERPNIKRLVKEKGYSYISGHTFSATFFYGLMIFLIALASISPILKIVLIIIFLLLILIIAYSRIYLGVHYLSDVIGGLLLGISYLSIYIYLTSFLLNLF